MGLCFGPFRSTHFKQLNLKIKIKSYNFKAVRINYEKHFRMRITNLFNIHGIVIFDMVISSSKDIISQNTSYYTPPYGGVFRGVCFL